MLDFSAEWHVIRPQVETNPLRISSFRLIGSHSFWLRRSIHATTDASLIRGGMLSDLPFGGLCSTHSASGKFVGVCVGILHRAHHLTPERAYRITGIRALPKASHFWATTVLEGDPDSGASTTDVLDNEVSPPQKAGGHNRVRLEADYCADTREYVLFNTWGNSPLFARHLHDIQIPTPTHASIVERVQYRE